VKRLVVLIAGVLIVLALAPSASARTDWRFVFTRAYWATPCDAHGGLVLAEGEYILPDGFELTVHETLTDPVTGTQTFDITIPTPAMSFSGVVGAAFVPAGGTASATFELRPPDNPNLLISVGMLYASCVTGEVRGSGLTIYGPHEPDPAERVMGTVQYDTPVYAEPDPTQALADTLKAGQTWFVVAETTGTDGQHWYQMYAGGWNDPWVPASAMVLDGPVPQ
jgi:hypothetical protein